MKIKKVGMLELLGDLKFFSVASESCDVHVILEMVHINAGSLYLIFDQEIIVKNRFALSIILIIQLQEPVYYRKIKIKINMMEKRL